MRLSKTAIVLAAGCVLMAGVLLQMKRNLNRLVAPSVVTVEQSAPAAPRAAASSKNWQPYVARKAPAPPIARDRSFSPDRFKFKRVGADKALRAKQMAALRQDLKTPTDDDTDATPSSEELAALEKQGVTIW